MVEPGRARFVTSGLLEPLGVYFYWWYKTPEPDTEVVRPVHKHIETQVLTLLVVKSKGRPKGLQSIRKQKGERESSMYYQFSIEKLC